MLMEKWINFLKLTNEIFKDFEPRTIPKYPQYKIDRFGNVYDQSDNPIKVYHYDDNAHYDSVYLKDSNNKHSVVGIHTLVSMTYDKNYKPGSIVHHKNENKYDNIDLNLEVTDRRSHFYKHHQPKYHDIEATCFVCGKKFIWTSDCQMRYNSDIKRGKNRIITCSRECASYYGRMKQLNKK